ncbi:ABC transporter permease [Texcoconibacillus texcoconensis]|nr:ABC transporter permease [Texcoconibacillus texcoconensis]
MSKFFIVMFHTFISKVKTKSFVFSTLVIAGFVLGLVHMDRVASLFDGGNQVIEVAVVTEISKYEEHLEDFTSQQDDIEFVEYNEKSTAKKDVKSDQLEAVFVINEDEQGFLEGAYYSESVAEQETSNYLNQELQQLKESIATEQLGLEQEQLEQIYEPVTFETEALSDQARSEEELKQARILVNILVMLIYFSVIGYGNMIATEVATEKSSRVMEILISSVSPVKQMFAKITGVALVGITQYVIIFVIAAASMFNRTPLNETNASLAPLDLSTMQIDLIVYAMIFFILGYLLFATIAATLGSIVSRIEDVNQLTVPLTLVVIVAFFISIFGLNTPDAPFVTIASYIPFFTPMVMFLRVGMLNLPFWEIALSIIILIATIALFAWIGARVYRGGVLIYGKSSSFQDIRRALKLSHKEK